MNQYRYRGRWLVLVLPLPTEDETPVIPARSAPLPPGLVKEACMPLSRIHNPDLRRQIRAVLATGPRTLLELSASLTSGARMVNPGIGRIAATDWHRYAAEAQSLGYAPRQALAALRTMEDVEEMAYRTVWRQSLPEADGVRRDVEGLVLKWRLKGESAKVTA